MAIAITSVQSQKLNLGIKVGANLTKITGKAFKEEYNLGYQAGVFAEIELIKSLGIQPEVLFNQLNTTRAAGSDPIYNAWQTNTSAIKLNYLAIPVLLRYNLTDILTINLGPQFGILLNKNESLWSNGKEALKSGDLSAVGGLTINLKSLRIYGRYVIGLNDLSDVPNTDSWKSQQVQLGIGLKL